MSKQRVLEKKSKWCIFSIWSVKLLDADNQLKIHPSKIKNEEKIVATIFYWKDIYVHFQDLFYNTVIKNIMGTNKAIFYTLNWAQSDCYLSPSRFVRLEMVRIKEYICKRKKLKAQCTTWKKYLTSDHFIDI